MTESIGMIHGICSLREEVEGSRQSIGRLPGFLVYIYCILYIYSKNKMRYQQVLSKYKSSDNLLTWFQHYGALRVIRISIKLQYILYVHIKYNTHIYRTK